MYVCMYVCVYVCMYVCMYVGSSAPPLLLGSAANVCGVQVPQSEQTGRLRRIQRGVNSVHMYVYMHVCMYVCLCVFHALVIFLVNTVAHVFVCMHC